MKWLLLMVAFLIMPPLFAQTALLNDKKVDAANERLLQAIKTPEYMLHHWIELPTSPASRTKKPLQLSLREAILLSLRYNPNVQSAELDRIIQRYQLRLAYNEFELQYALAGTAFSEKTHYSGIGDTTTNRAIATPEFNLKTKTGGNVALKMDNNVASVSGYNPLVNLSVTQPLLRGAGKTVNEANLLNAIDNEWLNKLTLQQAVMDEVTQVILAYRELVLSGNTVQTQRQQVEEAKRSYDINEKRIAAGQLEPTGNIQQAYQIESLNLMLEQAENDFMTAAQTLLQSIGLDPDMNIAVPDDVTLGDLSIPKLEEAVNYALTHNTQYLALTVQLRAAERAYRIAKNQQLWQLDLQANVQAGSLTDVEGPTGLAGIYNGNNVTESAGVILKIPFHDLSRRNELITTKVRLEKERLNLIAARRTLVTTIKNAINSMQSMARRYELAKRQVDLAVKSYALEKKKQQAGISSALDVNNTQNQLIQAKVGLISAKIAYLNQLSTLQRLLGTTLTAWQIQLRYGE